jgi:hypothetical protein
LDQPRKVAELASGLAQEHPVRTLTPLVDRSPDESQKRRLSTRQSIADERAGLGIGERAAQEGGYLPQKPQSRGDLRQ